MSKEIHFNDPDFDPRKHKPLPQQTQKGMSAEEHRRIVDDICKKAGVKEANIPDIDRLLDEAKRRIKNVRDYANQTADNDRAVGKEINRLALFKDVQSRLWDNFTHYNQEELFIILTTLLTQIVISEVV